MGKKIILAKIGFESIKYLLQDFIDKDTFTKRLLTEISFTTTTLLLWEFYELINNFEICKKQYLRIIDMVDAKQAKRIEAEEV